MKIFIADSTIKSIEQGQQVSEYGIYSHRTEDNGKVVWWIGAEPDTWLIIAGLLYMAGGDCRAFADAVASEFGMVRNTPED